VLYFRSANNLANAYGIAVASTMVIETALLHGRESRTDRLLLYCLLPLGAIDVTYFLSNIARFRTAAGIRCWRAPAYSSS
jgi:K+ transporter